MPMPMPLLLFCFCLCLLSFTRDPRPETRDPSPLIGRLQLGEPPRGHFVDGFGLVFGNLKREAVRGENLFDLVVGLVHNVPGAALEPMIVTLARENRRQPEIARV